MIYTARHCLGEGWAWWREAGRSEEIKVGCQEKGQKLGILVHCVVGTFNKYKARYAGEGTRRVTLTITWAAED